MAAACTSAPPPTSESACSGYTSSSSRCINTATKIGSTSYSTDWYLPNGTASGLMLLQHGFSRKCSNLRNTSRAIAEKGVMVLCINADMSGGNTNLANLLGDALTARNIAPPAGAALPQNYIVGGHSAGGQFASTVGARLDANNYARLKGAVMFDPVAATGFSANLAAIADGGGRPVLSIAARPNLANSTNNSFGALKDLANTFVGVQLVWTGFNAGAPFGGSCHTDVEGENGDLIGDAGSSCVPHATQTARLRDFGSTWARDLATGTRTAAYYCTNSATKSGCGSQVTALIGPTLPVAALIPVS